jgi:hypothetical protein
VTIKKNPLIKKRKTIAASCSQKIMIGAKINLPSAVKNPASIINQTGKKDPKFRQRKIKDRGKCKEEP